MKIKASKLLAVLCAMAMIVSTLVPMAIFTAAAAEATYSYTFDATQFKANGTVTLGDQDWTLAGDGGYWGCDASKGQQFGSKSKPYKSLTLTSSGDFNGVTNIVINTSGASGIAGSFTVSVDGTQVGSADLYATDTKYEFEVDNLTGAVEFSYTQTSTKAIYVKSITVTYTAGGDTPDTPTCEHTSTEAIGAKEATCTEAGITAGEKCADCGKIITEQEEIPALGHNYVNNTCTVCGATEAETEAPAKGIEAELSFADANNRTESTPSQQVWKQNGITLTYEKNTYNQNLAEYNNPLRLYKGTKATITADGNIITKSCSPLQVIAIIRVLSALPLMKLASL